MIHSRSKQDSKPLEHKGGRPKKPDSKSAVLVIRMTPAERENIERKAIKAGIKTSEWLRKAAQNATVTPRFTVEEMGWLRSLAGLCNNLNQLTRLAHREGLIPLVTVLSRLIKQVSAYLDKLKKDDWQIH